MRLARRRVLRPKLGVPGLRIVGLLSRHIHTPVTTATSLRKPLTHIFPITVRHQSTTTPPPDTTCESCNTPFQTRDVSEPGYFVEPKVDRYKKDDHFNELIGSMSEENLEFLAREQNLVSRDEPFDAAAAKLNYTEKLKVTPDSPRLCVRCHDLRGNKIDERPIIVKDVSEAYKLKEEVYRYNQDLLDQISAEPATIFLACSIHEFPANVPVFLKKKRNLKLVLTKAEGVVHVPQINSVNVQMWAAAQMQKLGFKMAAENVHFFSAEYDKTGGHNQFSMHTLQHEANAVIVGFPNVGKTSLFNVLQETTFSKDQEELRYALGEGQRALQKWRNVSWHPEHTLLPKTVKTRFGKLTDMPPFRRANSPWGLIKPEMNSILTDKMVLTEDGRKFAGQDCHIKKSQVALSSGLVCVEGTDQSELLVWTSIPGNAAIKRHTNAAKVNMMSKKFTSHGKALFTMFDKHRENMPQLVELGTATFDKDDGVGLEVAFEGAGFVRIKRTGAKGGKPTAIIWGFPGQVFAFRQPLCEIMLNNDTTVKGFFGLKDPNWRRNRLPRFDYNLDFKPTSNVEALGEGGMVYRVKEGAYTEFSKEQLLRADRKLYQKERAHRVERGLKLNNRERPVDGDEYITEADLEDMNKAREKISAKHGTSKKGKDKKKELVWTKVGTSKNIKSWKWLEPEEAQRFADRQDPECMWHKQKYKDKTFQQVIDETMRRKRFNR